MRQAEGTSADLSSESRWDIVEHLRSLELDLLTNATRKNAARVSALLADAFREFGSSGRIYTKEEIITALQEEAPVSIDLVDFEVMLLSEKVAIATYRSLKSRQGAIPETALRSSVWTRDGSDWRMIFHQGTKLS